MTLTVDPRRLRGAVRLDFHRRRQAVLSAYTLPLALALSRVGTVIIADNVVRKGAVIDADSSDPRVQGVRQFNELVARHPRLDATLLQTVGSKGYDGFTLARVVQLGAASRRWMSPRITL